MSVMRARRAMRGWLSGRHKPSRSDARVQAGSIVYAVGDIHGRLDLLLRLETLIAEDAAEHSAARRVVIYLGDYIDRGDDSAGVVDHLSRRPPAGFERVCLIGNHEAYLLRFLDDTSITDAWLANGGRETLLSYGVEPPGFHDAPAKASEAQSRLRDCLPDSHRAFLESLSYSHREGDYLFVHAGVRPGIPLDRQRRDDLIWIREKFLNFDGDFGAVVVHGHTIREQPDIRANRIGIDTGAYASERLTCVVLHDDSRRFLCT